MLDGNSPPPATESVRLLAVIVLYKLRLDESAAFNSLLRAVQHVSPSTLNFQILLYDNTPGGWDAGSLPDYVRYEAAQRNAGLAAAYNRAMEIAETDGYDWLLTLDQDTSLPEDFLSRLNEVVVRVEPNNSIAAIVPRISDNGKIVSPNWWLWDSIPRVFPAGFSGIPNCFSSAFNSASTVRVSSLQAIGGYDPRLWLDYSDAFMYRQLYKHGMRIYVAGYIHVKHELSVLDMNNRVTEARYRNILNAGCAFWDLELGWIAGLDHTARLAYRTFYKHWRRGHAPAFRRASWEMLKKRLFHSRKRRMEDWKRETEARLSDFPNNQGLER